MVMGDKSGLTEDCTSGESRDRASLDLPGVQEELVRAVVATGHARRARARGRTARRRAHGLHEHCAAVAAWRGCPARKAPAAIADVLDRRRESRREAAHLVPARGGSDARLLRPQGLGRAVALEGRLRRLAASAALRVRSRARATRRFELSDAADRERDGRAATDEIVGRGAGHQHGRPRPATRSCSSTCATRRRA